MKKASKKAVAPASEESQDEDLLAFARSVLGPGEKLLDSSAATPAAPVERISDAAALEARAEALKLQPPAGLGRVPWIETCVIKGVASVDIAIKKDGKDHAVDREARFYDLALASAKEGYRRLRAMKIPASRPDDFFAEMLRPDKTMQKVREKAADELKAIQVVEQRKAQKAAKKLEKVKKSDKTKKLLKDKKDFSKAVEGWKKGDKSESALEDVVSGRVAAKKAEKTSGKGHVPKKSKKQQEKDKKYGYGGVPQRIKKRNDKESASEAAAFGIGKKGKGKGKGRGKGTSKGRGKGGKK